MIENAAELDDNLIEKYLEGQEITIPELKASLRQSCINQ